jgi:hypothetical protein
MVSGLPLRRLDYIQTDVVVTTGTRTTTITQELLDDDYPNTVDDESIGQVPDHETSAVVKDTITPVISLLQMDCFLCRKSLFRSLRRRLGGRGPSS